MIPNKRSSEKFVARCIELAGFDLSCPLAVVIARYGKQLAEHPKDPGPLWWRYGEPPRISEFIFLMRDFQEQGLSSADLKTTDIGSAALSMLMHN
jgi:hypothetical protein